MKIKKILMVFLLGILLITGCDNLMNTPAKKVENLLSKYQKTDEMVLTQLGDTILSDTTLSVEQKEKYREIMERQYKNLTYTVKNEAIDGKTAVVETEIEVYDYNKAITEAENSLLAHPSDYQDETGNVNSTKYNDSKLKAMEDMKDRVTYTINFTLSKMEDEWVVDDLTEAERMKIHGLYAY